MKNALLAGVALMCLTALNPVQTAYATDGVTKQKGDLLVRGRLIGFLPDEGTDVPALGGSADASDEYVPELDFTYFVTDNVAVELVLATTKHDMWLNGSSAGNVDLGEVWVLPPVLTLQYHFDPMGQWNISPYLGAGVNYTIFYNEDGASNSAAASTDYENSFGYALQAGVDVPVAPNWFFNLDAKKVWVDTDLDVTLASGAKVDGTVDLDPWVLGVGMGYKF